MEKGICICTGMYVFMKCLLFFIQLKVKDYFSLNKANVPNYTWRFDLCGSLINFFHRPEKNLFIQLNLQNVQNVCWAFASTHDSFDFIVSESLSLSTHAG